MKFKSFFNFLFKKNAKISTSREDQIKIAKAHVKTFFEDSFDRNRVLDDNDGRAPRWVIHNNAQRHLEQIERNDITNEDFEIYYNELINIGTRAHTGHPLYRDLTTQPYPDNTIFGVLGRFFARPYNPQPRDKSTFEAETQFIPNENEEYVNEETIEVDTINPANYPLVPMFDNEDNIETNNTNPVNYPVMQMFDNEETIGADIINPLLGNHSVQPMFDGSPQR